MLGEEVLRLAPPPFSNRDLEARYRQVQAIGLAKIDAQVFLTAGLLWLAGIAVVLVHDGRFERHTLVLPAYRLLVWLIQHVAWRAYIRHRQLYVTVHRLLALLMPSVALMLGGFYSPEGHSYSPRSILSATCLGAQLFKVWVLGMGLRVGFGLHLLLHSLLAAQFGFTLAMPTCREAYHTSGNTQQFGTFARWLDRWLGNLLLIPRLEAEATSSHSPPSPESDIADCYAVLTTTHLVFGFFLCSAAVYITERHNRAKFLMTVANEMEAWQEQAPVQAIAEELGLAHEEVLRACMFDYCSAWLQCFVMLPHLAAVTFLAVRNLTPAAL